MSWFWGGAAAAPATGLIGAPPGTSMIASTGGHSNYSEGEVVEYYSATQGTWIPAKVQAINPNGTFNLDCKPDVPAEKIRKRVQPTVASSASFSVGETIEYYSASQGAWIPATILAVTPRGTYNLDCKPDVTPDKIRRKQGSSAGAGAVPSSGALSSGALASRPNLGGRKTSGGSEKLEMTAPVQLLKVERQGSKWHYSVCPEGAELLERYGSRRIAVASICGLYRTGKSYLLNMLLERVQRGLPLFQVGGTVRACTEGLWLWGSVDSDDEHSPLLAFLDCEGFGSTDADRTRDAQLMTLCTLLSSVLVLNTKGALNEGMFNALALSCNFAQHLEGRGSESSRPVLLWVIRDFMLELRDQSHRPISPDEYLEHALHAAPAMGYDQGRGQAAADVRQSLLKFFGHRSCATLVQPVIDEAKLQKLDKLPYKELRGEFRAGVEALRTNLIATCHSNPKAVDGQPLGCYSFVALMRQLVTALNESKTLSMRGAWETVQHTACGNLADELREQSCAVLRALASGDSLPGGARLPMKSEDLHTVLRDQRHRLKAEWDERAVGDEQVRKSYWQELKEALTRETDAVRQQNTRLADKQLQDAEQEWQDWLDDDTKPDAVGEQVSRNLGQLMERMPAGPLSRAGRAAIEAAARRVAAARLALAAATEQAEVANRNAARWGEHATDGANAARTEHGFKDQELRDAEDQLRALQHKEQSRQMEMQATEAELQGAKQELQASLQDVEAARGRISSLRAQVQLQSQREKSLKEELEGARQQAAAAEAERNAVEQCAKGAERVAAGERESLEAALKQERATAQESQARLTAEREALLGENDRYREEHSKLVFDEKKKLEQERLDLKGNHDKAKEEHLGKVEEARRQLDQMRRDHANEMMSCKESLVNVERRNGELQGQVDALSAEKSQLSEQKSDLDERFRECRDRGQQKKSKNDRVKSELAQVKEERARLERELAAPPPAPLEDTSAEEPTKPKCGCAVM